MRASVNGVELNYRDEGRGRPVVLLHGLGNTLYSWEGVARSLRTTYRVIRYDLRGSGASGVPSGPYEPTDFTADLRGLLDELEVESAHVVGHSLGSLIAARLAADRPERVRSVSLVGTGPGIPEDEEADRLAVARSVEEDGMATLPDTESVGAFSDHELATRPELLGLYHELLRSNDPAGYAAALRGMVAFDLEDRLAGIGAPALLVVGEADTTTPPVGAFLVARQLEDAHVVVFPDVGHLVPLTAPKDLAAELHEFLANL